MGPQEDDSIGKLFFSVAFFVLGVVLICSSLFVHGDVDAHAMLSDFTQLVMVISGCVCVIVGVVAFFHKDSFGTN
jgi:hypothetical protein